MKGEISFRDQKGFLYPAVNMFISAVKLGILPLECMRIGLLVEPQVVIRGTTVFALVLTPEVAAWGQHREKLCLRFSFIQILNTNDIYVNLIRSSNYNYEHCHRC